MIVLILSMLLKEFREHFRKELKGQYPEMEIETFFKLLMSSYFDRDATYIALHNEERLLPNEQELLTAALEMLKNHQPIQYILKESYFYGRSFFVDERVLIPRPETEELVQWILDDLEQIDGEGLSLLDVGTGSGCIAVSLAATQQGLEVHAMDVSAGALAVAKKNAELQGVKLHFFLEDIRSMAPPQAVYDLIVSNPPYVDPKEKGEMSPHVMKYEPHLALFFPQGDPLYFYKKIISFARSALKSQGSMYFEINPIFSKHLIRELKVGFFENIEIRCDIFGKQRMLKATKQ